MTTAEYISQGKASLGLELGSTRIKAVLISGRDDGFRPIASGSCEWENTLSGGIWTYSLTEVWQGLRAAFADLKSDVEQKYSVKLTKLASMGFSAMMHGYLAFDKNDCQLAEFRTWRNTITEEAAAKLTERFNFNIPQRWSIAHLYQAMLNKEEHVKDISFLTTLAGYVHWKLTGVKCLGIGDASGMFPIDSSSNCYDKAMLADFDSIISGSGYSFTLEGILPEILSAGEFAGVLTAEGAKLLDESGELEPGVPVAPPEGDAGTGMAATNSVRVRTGNISAGTSVFSMAVLEKPLKKVHTELDMVTTPTGSPVAMVHCNNCTSDINAWARMLVSASERFGFRLDYYKALEAIFSAALDGAKDCSGVMSINYFSGEPVTGLSEGRPMLIRTPDADFSFENLSRSLLYSACAALKIGNDILSGEEGVTLDKLYGHGGFFKAEGVGQRIMAAALRTPVSVMETAGEGGPWGMALLASYLVNKEKDETLEDFLDNKVFASSKGSSVDPDPDDVIGFDKFIEVYKSSLDAEKAAVAAIR